MNLKFENFELRFWKLDFKIKNLNFINLSFEICNLEFKNFEIRNWKT